jgi:hypothetical protein
MAGFTDALEHGLLDHVFNGAAYTQPTKWIGLFTAAPGETSTGTEVIGGVGYTRIAAPTWTAASSGELFSMLQFVRPLRQVFFLRTVR